ncbi:MAG: BON domain-containing protein [Bryobacteraceae bacterium]|jgi:osmotically-inducible protein OsmY
MATTDKAKSGARADEDMVRDIRQSWKLDSEVPDDRISVEVRDGVATLEGTVDRRSQKEAAEFNAKRVKGVRGVTNRIELQPAIPGSFR